MFVIYIATRRPRNVGGRAKWRSFIYGNEREDEGNGSDWTSCCGL